MNYNFFLHTNPSWYVTTGSKTVSFNRQNKKDRLQYFFTRGSQFSNNLTRAYEILLAPRKILDPEEPDRMYGSAKPDSEALKAGLRSTHVNYRKERRTWDKVKWADGYGVRKPEIKQNGIVQQSY